MSIILSQKVLFQIAGVSDKAIERVRAALTKYKDFLKKLGIDADIEEVVECLKEKKDTP
ncbi:MAG: hypothetical protein OWQ50_03105 [Acidianus infernus]|nr:hypothetical protein [Acidianus infernus]